MNIYTKLNDFKKEVGRISKDEKNPFFNSKYFDINGLLKHVEPLLQKNGLLLLQPIIKGEVVSEIIDIESGESITSSIALPAIQDPQKLGSAVTYYRRYTLQSLLCLQSEDDDANMATKSVKENPQKPWINKGDKAWNVALSKSLSLSKVKEHYGISNDNAKLYENELKAI
tara:strand:- start:1233 stop:1745 length:513 start_codon:yes stop_codon:yes gene_type:complete